MSTMKAIVVEQYGGPEVLRLVDQPVPEAAAGQALVRVQAAGLNFKDVRERSIGPPYSPALPFVPGVEGAGVVQAVGAGVDAAWIGQRVAYISERHGSYAEYATIEAEALVPLPDSTSAVQAAAVMVNGLTAQVLLHAFRPLGPGSTVLVHAAAGGMGLLLSQWAHHLGATVIGTVSTPEKAALAEAHGCHHTILYGQEDFVPAVLALTDGRGADLVLDAVGKTTLHGSLRAAAARGHVVTYGAASGPAEPVPAWSLISGSRTLSGAYVFDFVRQREELLQRAGFVFDALRAGWLRLNLQTMALADAAKAHRLIESRATTGKVVLTP
jgi:NADPH2:quinone reductase